jgi:hypothetical protein
MCVCHWHTKTLRILRLLYSRGEDDHLLCVAFENKKLKTTTAVCGAKAMPKPRIFQAGISEVVIAVDVSETGHGQATSETDLSGDRSPGHGQATPAGVVIAVDVSDDEVMDVSGCQTSEEWEQLQLQQRLQENILGKEEVEYILARRAEFEKGVEKLQQQQRQQKFEECEEKLQQHRNQLQQCSSVEKLQLQQQRNKNAPPGETEEERDERELQEDWRHINELAAVRQKCEDEKPKASPASASDPSTLPAGVALTPSNLTIVSEQKGRIQSLEHYRAGLEPDDGVGAWLKKKNDEDYEDYEDDPRTGSEDGPAPEPEDAAMDWKQDAAGCRWKKRELEAVGAAAIAAAAARHVLKTPGTIPTLQSPQPTAAPSWGPDPWDGTASTAAAAARIRKC